MKYLGKIFWVKYKTELLKYYETLSEETKLFAKKVKIKKN